MLSVLPHRELTKNNSIFLPILTNGDIDFAFMENCVAELEAERAAELEAYLTASGFKDCELTPKEIESLRNFSTLNFKEFNLERLFGKSTRGKRLKSSDRVQGNLPFVTAVNSMREYLTLLATMSRFSQKTQQRLICLVLQNTETIHMELMIILQLFIQKI